MSEGLLEPDHIPEIEQPPLTLKETGEEGEGGGVEEEVIPNDAAQLSSSHPAVPVTHLSSPSYSFKKRTGRQKKKPLKARQRAIAECRLGLLTENFLPVPFSPGKALDFSSHEQLFHALGLWEFSQLDLHGELRPDLLAHLIAYYDPSSRRSYVYGSRFSVSRVDLARAIALPTKKGKANTLESNKGFIEELVSADGAVSVLLHFMSNYMLFQDDMFILPPEISQAIKFVKGGAAYKVDWASVMWVLVEKELLDAPKTKTCFYASHLQRLIEYQNPVLVSKKLQPVLPSEPETEKEVSAADKLPLAEEGADADNGKMRSFEDLVKVASVRHKSEFGVTLGANVMNGFDYCNVNKERQWFEDGKDEGFEQCMRRCNSKAFDSIGFENFTVAGEGGKQEEGFANDLSVNFSSMEMMTLSDRLEEMENANIPYAQQVNHLNPSSGVLLTTRANSHKDDILDHGSCGSIYFGKNGKRKADEIVHEEEGQFNHNNQIKGMRSCEPWDYFGPLSFDECINQIHCGLKRASVLFAEKDQGVVNMEMQLQYMKQLLQEKEQVIRSLKLEIVDQQNWHVSVRQYENELCLVSQMMLGYKRALKETRSRFADYRKMHPHDEESLYKDVPGEGGLVLSVREFEKYQSVQEENKRQEFLGTFHKLNQVLNKLKECEECIELHDRKMGKLVGEMKQLKEGFVRSSCLDT